MTNTEKVIKHLETHKSISLKQSVRMGVIALSQLIGRMEKEGYRFLHIKVTHKEYFKYEYVGFRHNG